jgi:hypothetical protein
MNTILFKTTAELKKYVSGIDISYNLENMSSSFITARNEAIDAVSEAVWSLAQEHYNSENYNVTGQTNLYYKELDRLVSESQAAIANFAVFHHFIWLQIRVSNSGITIPDSDSLKAAYRYQTDEAKEELIKAAWAAMNRTIIYLRKTATVWTPWTALLEYELDSIILFANTYYKCIVVHTSTELFVDDIDNWEALTLDDIIFHEWTNSEQYLASANLIFTSERDFSKYYNIDNSAWFFQRIAFIIEEVIDDEIDSRISTFSELKKRVRMNSTTEDDNTLLRKIKKAVAYAAMAEAINRFSIHELPSAIRSEIAEAESTRRKTRKSESSTLKNTVVYPILRRAEKYLLELDAYLQAQADMLVAEPDNIGYTSWEEVVRNSENDKFVSL